MCNIDLDIIWLCFCTSQLILDFALIFFVAHVAAEQLIIGYKVN